MNHRIKLLCLALFGIGCLVVASTLSAADKKTAQLPRIDVKGRAPLKVLPPEKLRKSQMSMQWQLDQLRNMVQTLSVRLGHLEAHAGPAQTGVQELSMRISQLENALQVSHNGVTLQSPGTISISSGQLNILSPIVELGGTLKAVTVITDSVVAKTYTPGAGNVW